MQSPANLTSCNRNEFPANHNQPQLSIKMGAPVAVGMKTRSLIDFRIKTLIPVSIRNNQRRPVDKTHPAIPQSQAISIACFFNSGENNMKGLWGNGPGEDMKIFKGCYCGSAVIVSTAASTESYILANLVMPTMLKIFLKCSETPAIATV